MKNIAPAIYQQVLDLSCEIVNASNEDNTKAYWQSYNLLKQLCLDNKNTDEDHPLQWEALADFTSDAGAALKIYQDALALAYELRLDEYINSIEQEIAERFDELSE